MELDKSLMLSFITKSSSWKYENEWRLLLPVDICKIYDNMIPFFPIQAIYIGCRMPRESICIVWQNVGILKFMICRCMNIILNLKVSIAKPI